MWWQNSHNVAKKPDSISTMQELEAQINNVKTTPVFLTQLNKHWILNEQEASTDLLIGCSVQGPCQTTQLQSHSRLLLPNGQIEQNHKCYHNTITVRQCRFTHTNKYYKQHYLNINIQETLSVHLDSSINLTFINFSAFSFMRCLNISWQYCSTYTHPQSSFL